MALGKSTKSLGVIREKLESSAVLAICHGVSKGISTKRCI